MSNHPSKKANAYFQQGDHTLQSMLAKIKVLETLNSKLQTLLDPSLNNYCQVANVNGNCMIIVAVNGSIATQLRYQTADLLKQCQADPELQFIHDIQVKVRTHQPPSRQTSRTSALRKVATLTPETAEIIRHTAATIDDPKLREVLLRISEKTNES